MKPWLLAVLSVTMMFPAGAQPSEQNSEINTRLTEIREMLKPTDTDPDGVKQLKRMQQSYPDRWQAMIEKDQLVALLESGPGLTSQTDLGAIPGLAEKIAEFTKSVKTEIERSENAKVTAVEKMLAYAGDTLKNATKPEDLDELILKLGRAKIPEYGNNPRLSGLAREIQAAQQIAGDWQEYLIAEASGNVDASYSNLTQISSNLLIHPIVARSIVLRLLNSPRKPAPGHSGEPAKPMFQGIEEIRGQLAVSGDIAAAVAAVDSIPAPQRSAMVSSNFIQTLKSIDELRKLEPTMGEIEVIANIRRIENSLSSDRFVVARATDQIALNALARAFGIAAPSATTTSALVFLDRIVVQARAAQDWGKLRRAIVAMQALEASNYSLEREKRNVDLKFVSLMEEANAAMERGDSESAALACLDAQALEGAYLQREVAYRKLADIKQKDPAGIAATLDRAEEKKLRAEVVRSAAMEEARAELMQMRPYRDQEPREQLKAMRPLIEEVVAGFLQKQRLESAKDAKPQAAPGKK